MILQRKHVSFLFFIDGTLSFFLPPRASATCLKGWHPGRGGRRGNAGVRPKVKRRRTAKRQPGGAGGMGGGGVVFQGKEKGGK